MHHLITVQCLTCILKFNLYKLHSAHVRLLHEDQLVHQLDVLRFAFSQDSPAASNLLRFKVIFIQVAAIVVAL